MEFTPVVMCELDKQRVAVYKDENGNYFVTNTLSGKALLCLSITEALDIFDLCIEANEWSYFIN